MARLKGDTDIYLGLGSNMGDREAHIRWCLGELPRKGIRVTQISQIYETSPVGMYPEAGLFLNAVCRCETRLAPLTLLQAVKSIERDRGRFVSDSYASRVLDIDILLYGDYEVNVGELIIPHPRMFSRAFVLAPLADLAPCLEDPVTKLTVRQTLVDLGNGPETIRRRDMSEST